MADAATGHAIFTHELGFRRERLAGRELVALDPRPQDGRQLSVHGDRVQRVDRHGQDGTDQVKRYDHPTTFMTICKRSRRSCTGMNKWPMLLGSRSRLADP